MADHPSGSGARRGGWPASPTRARPAPPSGRLARWRADGALARDGARRRWTVVVVGLLVVLLLPAAVSAVPVSAPSVPVATLLARIQGSAGVRFSGYAVSHGALNLPSLDLVGGQVDGLVSDTSRLRVWWAAPDTYRVDRVTAANEYDVIRRPRLTWVWDSGPRRATGMEGSPPVQTPEPPDALPTTLARRLLDAVTPADVAAGRVHAIDARRVAGRSAVGLAWTPADPRSIVREIRVWADPSTGLPVSVEIDGVGAVKAYRTSFLDLTLGAPPASALTFSPRRDRSADIEFTPPDTSSSLQAPYTLPTTIAGLPQRSPARPFVATYGGGASLVVVVPVDASAAQAVRDQLDSAARPAAKESFGEASEIATPLVNALVFTSRDRGYVLAGTVTKAVLVAMAADLVQHPPIDVQEAASQALQERLERAERQRRAAEAARAARPPAAPARTPTPTPAPSTVTGGAP